MAYTYYEPKVIDKPAALGGMNVLSRPVSDVSKAFSKISTSGERMSLWCHRTIPGGDYLEYEVEALVTRRRNHFQGVQRLTQGNHVAISGCSSNESTAHLFIGVLPSRHLTLPWRSNCLLKGEAGRGDELVLVIGLNQSKELRKRFALDDNHWHAGGMGVAGDILAVPVEGAKPSDHSRILFFDVSDPEEPKACKFHIKRESKMAGAVALLGTSKDSILAAVLYADAGLRKLDFYVIQKKDLVSDTVATAKSFDTAGCQPFSAVAPQFGEYQSIQFVQQTDGQIFLVGLHNTGQSGHLNKPNVADLFRCEFWDNDPSFDSIENFDLRTLTKISALQFTHDEDWYDMDAGAGLYVDPYGGISLHACYGFKLRLLTSTSKRRLNFVEFRPLSSDFTPSVITNADDCWIDLFQNENCGGRCIGLVGKQETYLANLSDIQVRGEMMGFRISSVRFQIPDGACYTLFSKPSFAGGQLPLNGNGLVTTLANLKINNFGDTAASGRFTKI